MNKSISTKRFLILFSGFVAFCAFMFSSTTVKSTKIRPPAYYCNDPNPFTATSNCTFCHSSSPPIFDSTNLILLMGTDSTSLTNVVSGVTKYTPGTLYYLRINATKPSPVHGFELTADDTLNTGAEVTNFAILNPVTTSLISVTYNFVGHHNADSNSQWTFTWLAPTSYQGPVTFYYAGNDGVAGDTQYGDTIYLASKTITANPVNGINGIENKLNSLSVYPTVFDAHVQISFTLSDNAKVQGSVVNLYGQVVKNILDEGLNAGSFNRTIDLSSLAAGIYLVKIQVGDAFEVRKIIKD